ncbi:MAG TPA: twin-arginine translocase TatA/TatE family subunit [Acidimicrobiales bacterium]|nr:twin-arginine translocase TatA/TatE family subunit [Acidimicrobiales bacterium]
MLANIYGPDLFIVLAVVALLFGGSQLPKLARSLGSASHEFKKGVEEGGKAEDKAAEAKGKPEEKAATEDKGQASS